MNEYYECCICGKMIKKDMKNPNSLEDIFKLTNILTDAIVLLRDEDLEEYIITCIVNKMDANEDLFNIFKES